MSFLRNTAAFTFAFIFLVSCKKDNIQLNYIEQNSGISTALRGVFFLNESTGFICGGEKNESGVILKTIDGGQTWAEIFSYHLALRDITFVNDTLGFACGDSLLILKTTDGGATWNKMQLPYTPIIIVPFTSIQFRDAQHGYVCGGKNWENGIAMRTADGGVWWDYQAFYDTEITENVFINDSTGYLTAFGAVYKTTSDHLVNNLLDIDGDFFTSACFCSPDDGFVCGYEGSIYKTGNAGSTWKQVRKDNGAFNARAHLNKIRFTGTQKGFAVGNNGFVSFSDDAGETWKQSDNFPAEDIFSVFILNSNSATLCGENGKIYKVEF